MADRPTQYQLGEKWDQSFLMLLERSSRLMEESAKLIDRSHRLRAAIPRKPSR
jgi:hypothetical protein